MTDPLFDITPFLTQAEGQHFDRKSMFEGPPGAQRPRKRGKVREQAAEYVAAFANADGGVLVLGIEDDGTVTGHSVPPKADESAVVGTAGPLGPSAARWVRGRAPGEGVDRV